MSITREQLKVGERYIHPSLGGLEVLAIGEIMVFNKWDTGSEALVYLGDFLKGYSLAPKPKKKIKLIGYIFPSGAFHEYDASIPASDCSKKVSEREIEVEDV